VASHSTYSLGPKRLRSGNYLEVCSDCGTRIVRETLDEVLASTCGCGGHRITRHAVELTCMLCNRSMGCVTVTDERVPVLLPAGLRCRVCGGRPVVDEEYRTTSYLEVHL
jgi:hypothetical protein